MLTPLSAPPRPGRTGRRSGAQRTACARAGTSRCVPVQELVAGREHVGDQRRPHAATPATRRVSDERKAPPPGSSGGAFRLCGLAGLPEPNRGGVDQVEYHRGNTKGFTRAQNPRRLGAELRAANPAGPPLVGAVLTQRWLYRRASTRTSQPRNGCACACSAP